MKFATYTFENNPQGKFMLQIMFGQSKYYSDALSENVKRGNRTKLEQGWRPNLAPLGYLNDPTTKRIVVDAAHFPLIRRMFDLLLSGHSPRAIAIAARDEWGFRTPKRRKIGGVPLAMSSVYKILGNPFYAGLIVWGGQIYPGKHTPVVSIDEFSAARQRLSRAGTVRPKTKTFAYTGIIRCGLCGLMVTAESKQNRFGSTYIYYHCTKRSLGQRCPERSIELRSLETQIVACLRGITLHPEIAAWLNLELGRSDLGREQELQARNQTLGKAIDGVVSQLTELTSLRLRALLTDDEFLDRRRSLHTERLRLEAHLAGASEEACVRFEPFADAISFSNYAVDRFLHGDDREKRIILQSVGSNPILANRKLSIQAAKPFVALARKPLSPSLLAAVEDVRTRDTPKMRAKARRILKRLAAAFEADPQRDERIKMLRELREIWEALPTKEKRSAA